MKPVGNRYVHGCRNTGKNMGKCHYDMKLVLIRITVTGDYGLKVEIMPYTKGFM